MTTVAPSRDSEDASSANDCAGHRLAPPYAAPGASATSGRRLVPTGGRRDPLQPLAPSGAGSRRRLGRPVRKAERSDQVLIVGGLMKVLRRRRGDAVVNSGPRQSVR